MLTHKNPLDELIDESMKPRFDDLAERNLVIPSIEHHGEILLSGHFTKSDLAFLIRWMDYHVED